MTRRMIYLAMLVGIVLAACEPEVGSEAWCKKMDDKPKGDWTANEAGDYLKHCVVRSDEK